LREKCSNSELLDWNIGYKTSWIRDKKAKGKISVNLYKIKINWDTKKRKKATRNWAKKTDVVRPEEEHIELRKESQLK
jgi:hypothetical protein